MVSNAVAAPGQPAAAPAVGCWQSTCGPHRRLLQINGLVVRKCAKRGILTKTLALARRCVPSCGSTPVWHPHVLPAHGRQHWRAVGVTRRRWPQRRQASIICCQCWSSFDHMSLHGLQPGSGL